MRETKRAMRGKLPAWPSMQIRMAQYSDELCIVVNPRPLVFDVRTRLERDRRVMIFDDLNAFERWRSRCASTSGLTCEVTTALREIGQDGARLPRDLARAVERLARQSITPTVREFVTDGQAERTFYRRWNRVLPVRPKQFLDRVRFLHALRLIEQLEYSIKEAAALAGYGCADALRAVVRRQKAP
jgi:AraC-like DNA-binding protein